MMPSLVQSPWTRTNQETASQQGCEFHGRPRVPPTGTLTMEASCLAATWAPFPLPSQLSLSFSLWHKKKKNDLFLEPHTMIGPWVSIQLSRVGRNCPLWAEPLSTSTCTLAVPFNALGQPNCQLSCKHCSGSCMPLEEIASWEVCVKWNQLK